MVSGDSVMRTQRFCNVSPLRSPSAAGDDPAATSTSPRTRATPWKDGQVTHEHDHDVIVEERGSGLGTALGIVLIVALLAAIWWFALGPGSGGSNTTSNQPNVNVQVQAPSQPASS